MTLLKLKLIFLNINFKNGKEIKHHFIIFGMIIHIYIILIFIYWMDYNNIYIEVKGFRRPRDPVKWEICPNLIIIKKSEMDKIYNNTYTLPV